MNSSMDRLRHQGNTAGANGGPIRTGQSGSSESTNIVQEVLSSQELSTNTGRSRRSSMTIPSINSLFKTGVDTKTLDFPRTSISDYPAAAPGVDSKSVLLRIKTNLNFKTPNDVVEFDKVLDGIWQSSPFTNKYIPIIFSKEKWCFVCMLHKEPSGHLQSTCPRRSVNFIFCNFCYAIRRHRHEDPPHDN